MDVMYEECGGDAASLSRALVLHYDRVPEDTLRLPRQLYESYVTVLFSCVEKKRMSKLEFSRIFSRTVCKMREGEPVLAKLLAKSTVEVGDDFVTNRWFEADYIVPEGDERVHSVLIEAGKACEFIYLVIRGSLTGWSSSNNPAWSFNEVSVDPSFSSAADAKNILLRIPRSTFERVILPNSMLVFQFVKGLMKEVESLKSRLPLRTEYSYEDMFSLTESTGIEEYVPPNTCLVPQGHKCEGLYGVVEGMVLHGRDEIGPGRCCALIDFFLGQPVREGLTTGPEGAMIRTIKTPQFSEEEGNELQWLRLLQSFVKDVSSTVAHCEEYTMLSLVRGDVLPADKIAFLWCGRVQRPSKGKESFEYCSSRQYGKGSVFAGGGRACCNTTAIIWDEESYFAPPKGSVIRLFDSEEAVSSFSTIVVVPVHASINEEPFVVNLKATLEKGGSQVSRVDGLRDWTTGVSFETAIEIAPIATRSALSKLRASSDVVIAVAQTERTQWLLECLAMADLVFFVDIASEAKGDPFPNGKFFQFPLKSVENLSCEKQFVLLHNHDNDKKKKSNTRQRCFSSRYRPPGIRLTEFHHVSLSRPGDYQRLCRYIRREAVGVVLGGHAEGAASFAYLGVLLAFVKEGIPVDVIGGSHYGAVVAAMFALGHSFERMNDRLRAMSPRFSAFDVVVDFVAHLLDDEVSFAGRLLERIRNTFQQRCGDGRIPSVVDDMSVASFFASVTHLRSGKPFMFSQGEVSGIVKSCISIPLLSPDPFVSGSYGRSLPSQEARNRGCSVVFSVNVISALRGSVAGSWWSSWLLGNGHSTLSRMAQAACCNTAKEDADFVLQLEMGDVFSDFSSARQATKKGFFAATDAIKEMRERGDFDHIENWADQKKKQQKAGFEWVRRPSTNYVWKVVKITGYVAFFAACWIASDFIFSAQKQEMEEVLAD